MEVKFSFLENLFLFNKSISMIKISQNFIFIDASKAHEQPSVAKQQRIMHANAYGFVKNSKATVNNLKFKTSSISDEFFEL